MDTSAPGADASDTSSTRSGASSPVPPAPGGNGTTPGGRMPALGAETATPQATTSPTTTNPAYGMPLATTRAGNNESSAIQPPPSNNIRTPDASALTIAKIAATRLGTAKRAT